MSFLHQVSGALRMIRFRGILLIISLFSLFMTNPRFISSCTSVLEQCCLYLSDTGGDWHPMTARASQDYLHKINKALVQRGPVTFETFKDFVTSPLSWERYSRPVLRDEARASSTWCYKLFVSKNVFPNSSLLFYDFIPFSQEDDSFQRRDFDELKKFLFPNGPWENTVLHQSRLTDLWLKIQTWMAALNRDSMTLYGDRPGTRLHGILEWWRNFVPNPLPDSASAVHIPPQCATLPFPSQTNLESSRLSSVVEEFDPPASNGTPQVGLAHKLAPPLPPPCGCRICQRPLHENGMDAALLSVASMEVRPAAKHCAFVEEDDTIETSADRRFGRMAVATETRVSRSFSSSNSDEDQSSDEVDSLQPPRKKQKMTYNFEHSASDTDSMMTEVDNGPPDSSYEDDLSVNEDFWSAKSTAELSLASLD